MSARVGMAAALARVWRRKREPDAIDLIDEEVAQITDEHIENRLRETLRTAGLALIPEVAPEPETAVKPARRCRSCGYVKDSDSCRIMCGEGS